MEYKRSSHVGEEEDEEEEDGEEEEEIKGHGPRHHHFTTAAAATGAARQQQHGHAQVLGSSVGSSSSSMEAAAFSRPFLPPNSSLVSSPSPPQPQPPGFLSPPHHLHRRREEREGRVDAHGDAQRHRQQQVQRNHEPAKNGVLGDGNMPPPAPTLALVTGGGVTREGEHGGAAGGAEAEAEALPWRYRECLRNHAARLGAHVLDGCGEFMLSPGDGTAALACAACGCHRSFHRREAVVAPPLPSPATAVVTPSAPPTGSNSSRLMPLLLAPPHMQKRPSVLTSPMSAPDALAESSSEELRPPPPPPAHAHAEAAASASAPPGPSKKRFRTKFKPEQKERMLEFAHRVGWRIQKPDGGAVDAFCAQVGVSRRVLKVWMHNNKHLAKTPPPLPPLHHDHPHPHHHHSPQHHNHHHHQQQQQQH